MNKEINYAVKSDKGKPKLSLVPRQIIWDIAAIREYGNNKYPDGGPDNWRSVEPDRYRDAAYRHFLRYLDNPSSVDDESGLPHLWHLACNIAFLCEVEAEDKESITLYKNDKPYLVINPDNGSGIKIDDRVSITMPKTESIKRSCVTCKYDNLEKCKTCDALYSSWTPKTEVEE